MDAGASTTSIWNLTTNPSKMLQTDTLTSLDPLDYPSLSVLTSSLLNIIPLSLQEFSVSTVQRDPTKTTLHIKRFFFH